MPALCATVVALCGTAAHADNRVAAVDDEWRAHWRVAAGFAIDVDASGFTHPTAIAFVRTPGAAPADPLYFVTELGGRVVVVTNDRKLHTFAQEDLALDLAEPLPSSRGEGGMAGIALDSERGFVFVSALVEDKSGVLRNRIVRYETAPDKFGLTPTQRTMMDEPFAAHISAVSHQIGPMVIDASTRLLYVGVGDGKVPANARSLASPNGKILRMTLDGAPAPANPFADRAGAAPWTFALGLRNPFSLAFVGDALIAGDNGPAVDRFVRVEAGRDFLYDGTDWSIGMAAEVVVAPSVSPVQMQFLPLQAGDVDTAAFPAMYRSRLYVAFAGNAERKTALGEKGVATLEMDPATHRFSSRPEMFLQYTGESVQTPVGLAFGPDGLYVVSLFATHRDGSTAVLRVHHDPARAHPHSIDRDQDVPSFMKAKGCFGCHTRLASRDVPVGPPLDRASLVRTRPDAERLARFIRDPRLDDPRALMPALGLTEWEARRVADWLLSTDNRIEPDDLAPEPWYRTPVTRMRIKYAFIGAISAFLLCAIAWRLRQR